MLRRVLLRKPTRTVKYLANVSECLGRLRRVIPTNLAQAEAHLTCLKIVEPGASDSGPPGLLNSASFSFSIPRTWMVVEVALLFTVHIWLENT